MEIWHRSFFAIATFSIIGCSSQPKSSATQRSETHQRESEKRIASREEAVYEKILERLNAASVADGDSAIFDSVSISHALMSIKANADVYSNLSHQDVTSVNQALFREWFGTYNKLHHTNAVGVELRIVDRNGEQLYYDRSEN